LTWEILFRDWLIISAVLSGIIFVGMGLYYLKSDPDSWVSSPPAMIELPEWFSYIYAGAFFIIMGMIVFLYFP